MLTTGCNSLVNLTSVSSPAAGGNITVSVQTGPNCAWTVMGLPTWITLQSPPALGPGNAILDVASNSGPPRSVDLVIAGQQVSITQASTLTFAPAISLVANAFGDTPLIAPNTWIEIKGANLSPAGDSRAWQSSDFINNDMPTSLDGVSVLMNGANAYVYSISRP